MILTYRAEFDKVPGHAGMSVKDFLKQRTQVLCL